MTELNPVYGSPFIQKESGSELFEIMERLKKRYPRGTAQKLQQLWTEEILDDPKQTELAVRSEAIRVWSQVDRLDARRPRRIHKSASQKASEAKERAKKVAEAVKSTKSIWLASAMSATFGELAKVGGQFAKLSKMGKPNQRVSDVLSEAQVSKVLK